MPSLSATDNLINETQVVWHDLRMLAEHQSVSQSVLFIRAQTLTAERGEGESGGARAAWRDVVTVLVLWTGTGHVATQQRDATKLISDLSARGNPRGRLARDQCIPPGALLTGGLGKAKI